MHIRQFDISDKQAVIQLWEDCGLTRPWNDPSTDIERKLMVQPELFLVGTIPVYTASATNTGAVDAPAAAGADEVSHDQIIASVMAGYDGHRGWLHFAAVAPEHQKKGYGRQLIHRAEQLMQAMGCQKVNLQVRSDNQNVIDFYRSLGYSQDSVSGMGRKLDSSTVIEEHCRNNL